MTKNQKMLLGVGAVAVVGYLVYQQMNKSKGFSGQIFAPMSPSPVFKELTAGPKKPLIPLVAGGTTYTTINGMSVQQQWISLGGHGANGYWSNEIVPQGTIVGYAMVK